MAATSTFSSSDTLHTIPLLPLATFLRSLTSAENIARLQDVLVKHRSPESWERVDERMISSGDLPPPGYTSKLEGYPSDESTNDIKARNQNQDKKSDRDEDEDENEEPEGMEWDHDHDIVYPSPPKRYIQEIRMDLRTLHPRAIFALESWRRETLGMEQLVIESRGFAAGLGAGAGAENEVDHPYPEVSSSPKTVQLRSLDILFRGGRERSESTSTDETSSVEIEPIPIRAKAKSLMDGLSVSGSAKGARVLKTYGSSKRLSSSLTPIHVTSSRLLLSPTPPEVEKEKAEGRENVIGERLEVVNASKHASEQRSVPKKRRRGRPRKKTGRPSRPVQTSAELGEEISATKSDGREEEETDKSYIEHNAEEGKERTRRGPSSRLLRSSMPTVFTSKAPDIFESEEELESFSSEDESEMKKQKRIYRRKEKGVNGGVWPKKRGRPRKRPLVLAPPPADMSLQVNRPAKGTFANPIKMSISVPPVNNDPNTTTFASLKPKSTTDSRNASPTPSLFAATLPKINANSTLPLDSTSSTSSSSSTRPQRPKRKNAAGILQAAEFQSDSELTELSEMSELEARPQSQSQWQSRFGPGPGSGIGSRHQPQSQSIFPTSASASKKHKNKSHFDGVLLPSFTRHV
ncbi:hypothetical protein C356_00047 [Cryptococcus neoformans c45]|nr:hypothetical protein C356_00047 [Cryptococcus neoformans var. grubii c45]